MGGRASDDAYERAAIGTREQDETQTPCCYPHLPDAIFATTGRAARAGSSSSAYVRLWRSAGNGGGGAVAALVAATEENVRSSCPPVNEPLETRGRTHVVVGRAAAYVGAGRPA